MGVPLDFLDRLEEAERGVTALVADSRTRYSATEKYQRKIRSKEAHT